jgi:hypothetical protein
MNSKILSAMAVALLLSACSSAPQKTAAAGSATVAKDGPVEFDTPDAHVIVVRALDSWSGDNSASEDSLDAVKDHEGGFRLASEKGPRYDVLGFPMLFGLNGDSESNKVVQGVVVALKPFGFKLAQVNPDFTVDTPENLYPKEFATFANSQREFYKSFVISEGNPATLHRSVSAKKFLAGVLSLATIGIAGDKFGALGSQTVLNTGVAGDIQQLSASGRAALVPLDLPNFDASGYKSIEVRKVVQGNNDRLGQVIIAYKNDKTEEITNAALINAIVTLTGADTTPEAIQQARDTDLAKRQAIWDACVAEGKCK